VARRRSLPARLLRGLLLLCCALAATSVALVALLRWVPVPVTSFMIQDRLGALVAREAGYRYAHDWVPWQEISPHAAVAVIAAEDQKFTSHRGFDFQQIDRALTAAERGQRMRGASTISQQLAKNLFLWPGRSWIRKGLEAYFTVLLELLWPKQRILEVYLNSVEFGRGVWGVEAASQRFFGRPARQLTRQQAALLAAVLPNPRRFRVDNPTAYVKNRQAWILRQMSQLGGVAHLDRLGARQ